MKELKADFQGMFTLPENFVQTAPIHTPEQSKKVSAPAPQISINPQTSLLCEMLGLTNPFAVFSGKQTVTDELPSLVNQSPLMDDSALADDSSVASDDFADEPSSFINSTFETSVNTTTNPDEIMLDDEDDDIDDEEKECLELLRKKQSLSQSAMDTNIDEEEEECLAELRKRQSLSQATTDADFKTPSPIEHSKEGRGDAHPNLESTPKSGSPMKSMSDDASNKNVIDGNTSGVGNSPIMALAASSSNPSSPSTNRPLSPSRKRPSSEFLTDTTESESAGNVSSTESPVKARKFKRRNVSCYASADDS